MQTRIFVDVFLEEVGGGAHGGLRFGWGHIERDFMRSDGGDEGAFPLFARVDACPGLTFEEDFKGGVLLARNLDDGAKAAVLVNVCGGGLVVFEGALGGDKDWLLTTGGKFDGAEGHGTADEEGHDEVRAHDGIAGGEDEDAVGEGGTGSGGRGGWGSAGRG